MEKITSSENYFQRFREEKKYRSERDELVDKYVTAINKERKGTKWKPVSHRYIAIKINTHPVLGKSNGELWNLYKECESKGSFSKFFWVTQ